KENREVDKVENREQFVKVLLQLLLIILYNRKCRKKNFCKNRIDPPRRDDNDVICNLVVPEHGGTNEPAYTHPIDIRVEIIQYAFARLVETEPEIRHGLLYIKVPDGGVFLSSEVHHQQRTNTGKS